MVEALKLRWVQLSPDNKQELNKLVFKDDSPKYEAEDLLAVPSSWFVDIENTSSVITVAIRNLVIAKRLPVFSREEKREEGGAIVRTDYGIRAAPLVRDHYFKTDPTGELLVGVVVGRHPVVDQTEYMDLMPSIITEAQRKTVPNLGSIPDYDTKFTLDRFPTPPVLVVKESVPIPARTFLSGIAAALEGLDLDPTRPQQIG